MTEVAKLNVNDERPYDSYLENVLNQKLENAATHMQGLLIQAAADLDLRFGKDYSKANPALLAAYLEQCVKIFDRINY